MIIPASLLDRETGGVRPPPPVLLSALACPECGSPMQRSQLGWGCARILSHIKITHDRTILRRIYESLPADTVDPSGEDARLLRFAKARQRFCLRNGVDDAPKPAPKPAPKKRGAGS